MRLRELQLFELQMLKEITKVCDDNKIEYFLSSGTFLGAIRHEGFIPWDDDIDLYMTVKNYRKFMKIGQKCLGDKYFVQNYRTENGYYEQWTKVLANGTTAMPKMFKKWNVNFGIYIDIFPIVGVSDDKKKKEKQAKALKLNRELLCDLFMIATNQPFTLKQRILFSIPRSIRKLICRINERRFMLDIDDFDNCTEVWYELWKEYPSKLFMDSKKYKFEDSYFNGMKDYDTYLNILYGDYMQLPPETERKGHDLTWGDIIYDLHNDYSKYMK